MSVLIIVVMTPILAMVACRVHHAFFPVTSIARSRDPLIIGVPGEKAPPPPTPS